jgi:L,D-peptidoglycan transpeptidase YkuD (ErfK/YbiS/YcfS/YnhG family)
MNLLVSGDGEASWGAGRYRCALGRGGLARDKREGDGATPLGSWPMRRLLYRADRLALPPTGLAVQAISPDDGWCDDPAAPQYNRPIRFPLAARAERLWRDDGLYDLVVPLGYNDDPIRLGAGSAIFLHVARPDYGPTEGCVALAMADLLAILRDAGPGSRVIVGAAGEKRP